MQKSASLTIALDAMGGDFGPQVVIPGANISLIHHPDTHYLLFGDQVKIRQALEPFPKLAAQSEIIHTDLAIAMDDKPSHAVRHGRHGSSMWLALEAVKDKRAQAVVSGGNTGALMAMAKLCLKMLPGIERPALAAIWPTVQSECIVLDVGANVGATSTQLFDFALMGAAMARTVLGREKPSVGLLNIGVEEVKGLEEIKKAGALLKASELPMHYKGFVEGDAVGHGAVDVVVCDGFIGNIALKTAEGTAKQISQYLKAAMSRTLAARIGAFFAQGAFQALKSKMDPRQLNGGPFLGVNGIVIKSHGGTDETGFASAIDLAYDMANKNIVEHIAKDVENFHDQMNAHALENAE